MENLFLLVVILINPRFIDDPAVGYIKFNRDYPNINRIVETKPLNSYLLYPPQLELILTASANQETVYVSFTSNQDLYAGWTNPKLCSNYQNWDYWWLNTRLGIDSFDSLYVLVSLYNYSNSNYNFHRDVLDYSGALIHQDAEWNGYHQQPIIKDGAGRNIYIGHPVLGWNDNMDAGAVDFINYIYSSKADASGNLYFTLLDSVGNFVYEQVPVFIGDTAQSWPGDSHLEVDSQGNIYICWSRNMNEIVYTKSSDGGVTWSLPIVVAFDFVNQVNKPEILIGPNDCIYFIWQHWTGAHNCLVYKKLYPDGTCSVDITNLTPQMTPEVWAPEFAMDSDTNIHIVWSTSYQGSNSLYYTLIDGKLDKAGAPASDSELTIVQEYAFYTASELNRYPKIVIDSLNCPDVIFDQGPYGTGTDKSVYHMKKTLPPQGIAIFPDSSKLILTIDTTNGYNSYFLTSGPGRYFVRVWGWNQLGELGWDTASIYITAVQEQHTYNFNEPLLKIYPQPFTKYVKIILSDRAGDFRNLKIYNSSGRLVRTITCHRQVDTQKREIIWDGSDELGNSLPAGCYFIKLDNSPRIYKLTAIK